MTYEEYESAGLSFGVPYPLLKMSWPGPYAEHPFDARSKHVLNVAFQSMLKELEKYPAAKEALRKVASNELSPGEIAYLEERGKFWTKDILGK